MYEYSDFDAEFTQWWMLNHPAQPDLVEDAYWWMPDGIGTWQDVQWWYATQTYLQCPYYIRNNGGPEDLPGRFGPGTCGGSCWEEPECMTIGPM